MGIVPQKSRGASRNGKPADIASIRRAEIIEAATSVIAEQGIQELSLSAIESRSGMSRGQLTYYFRTKEAILLAVFDHLLQMMYARMAEDNGEMSPTPSGWDMIEHLLDAILNRPPLGSEFHSLQYTFLSQIGHRRDYRQRLAELYGQWRGAMADGIEQDGQAGRSKVSARAAASLVQAILHGLSMQLAADPDAFDRTEMSKLCRLILGNYLRPVANKKVPGSKPRTKRSGAVSNQARTRTKGKPR